MARSPANFLRTLARAIDHLFITIGLIYYDWTQRKFPWPLTGGPVFPVPRGPPGISPDRAAGHRILWVNHRATIIWHTERIPDEYRLTPPRPDPERIDLAAIKTDLEFAINQISRLHRQLARTALGIIFSTAVITTLLGWCFLAR